MDCVYYCIKGVAETLGRKLPPTFLLFNFFSFVFTIVHVRECESCGRAVSIVFSSKSGIVNRYEKRAG